YDDKWSSEPLAAATAEIVGPRDQYRTLMFLDRKRKLAAAVSLSPERDPPRQLVLRACGTISGRIVDADHKPVADLYVHVNAAAPAGEKPTGWARTSFNVRHRVDYAQTDQDGKFRVELVAPDIGYVVRGNLGKATVEKTTPVLQPGQAIELGDLTLRSPEEAANGNQTAAAKSQAASTGDSKEKPDLKKPEIPSDTQNATSTLIRGRVLDLEGRAVAGARVQVITAWESADMNGKLDDWLAAVRSTRTSQDLDPVQRKLLREIPDDENVDKRRPVSTDAEGRFEIDAGGDDRVVQLRIDGEGIESLVCRAITRPIGPLRLAGQAREIAMNVGNPREDLLVYGSSFEHVAAPGCEVEGVVRDAKTHAPLPGVTVVAERWSGGFEPLFRATTDGNGHYRLSGISARSKPTQLAALAGPDSPYIAKVFDAKLERPGDRATVDFELSRGVWLAGRVTDKATGRGVEGVVSYHAFADNPNLKRTGDGFSPATFKTTRANTDSEGDFRLLVLPGRGLVAADAGGGYAIGIGSDKLRDPKAGISSETQPNIRPEQCNAIIEVVIAEDADAVRYDIELEPGRQRSGGVLGPAGEPLAGAHLVAGWKERWFGDRPLDGVQFTIEELVPGRKRTVVVLHEAHKLIGAIEVSGDGDAPFEVRLQPWAAVRGRLVDDAGEPLSDLSVETRAAFPRKGNIDRDGRFELDRLVPGAEYELTARYDAMLFPAARGITLRPGEVRDLGDLVVEIPDREQPSDSAAPAESRPNRADNAKDASSSQPAKEKIIRGRVLLPDGEPAEGAEIYWMQSKSTGPESPGELWWEKRAATDAEGRFQWTLEKTDAKIGPSNRPPLVAYKPGFGVDGISLGRDEANAEINLRLVKDQTIRGRLTDTEGRAVAGAQVSVTSIQSSREGGLDPFLNAWKQSWRDAMGKLDRKLPILRPLGPALSTVSDKDGRFELSGAGAERLVLLNVSATGFMSEEIQVVTRDAFNPEPYNESAVANSIPQARTSGRLPRLTGAQFDRVLEAELVIRGSVFTGADRRPVTGGNVSSSGGGWTNSVSAKIDDAGHFELRGARRSQDAYLHVAAHFAEKLLSRTVRLNLAPGQTAIAVDVELKAALVVEGRVFDRATGSGVKSGVRFVALPGNKYLDDPGYEDAKRTAMTMTTDEGHYRLLVIPGPGVIMAQVQGARPSAGIKAIKPYRQGSFSEEDGRRVPVTVDGDDRHFTVAGNTLEFLGSQNALKFIDLAPDDEPAAIDLPFEKGGTAQLTIEDEQGQPVTNAYVSGLADCWPHTFRIGEANCEIVGLGADRPRRVCIFQPERHLAATLDLTGDEPGPVTVRLTAPASVSGRALDPDGEPLADVVVQVNYIRRSASELNRFVGLEQAATKTDGDGHFHVDDILPGERLMLGFKQGDAYFYLGGLTTEQRQLAAGQNLEVSDVKLKRVR
ncbi:MAG: hypothetical protein ACREHD_11635, partial [Pirellulales bacterium]